MTSIWLSSHKLDRRAGGLELNSGVEPNIKYITYFNFTMLSNTEEFYILANLKLPPIK